MIGIDGFACMPGAELRFQSTDRAVQLVLDRCIPMPSMGVLPITFNVVGCTANSLIAKEWTILVKSRYVLADTHKIVDFEACQFSVRNFYTTHKGYDFSNSRGCPYHSQQRPGRPMFQASTNTSFLHHLTSRTY